MDFIKKYKKPLIFVMVIIAVIILDRIFGWSKYLGNIDNLMDLKDIVDKNILLAMGIYILVTVVGSVVLALPGVTFAIFAGILFGPFWGTILCTFAATLGAMLAFLCGRFFLQDSLKPLVSKNALLKKWLFDESGKNELFVLMITRIIPVFPFNLQNFAYGITDIGFFTYSIGTFVFILPGSAIYTIGSSAITDPENRITLIVVALITALVVFGMVFGLKRRYIADEK